MFELSEQERKERNRKIIMKISREEISRIYSQSDWEAVKASLATYGIELKGREAKDWKKGWYDWHGRRPSYHGTYEPPPDPPEIVRGFREQTKGASTNALVCTYYKYLEKINNRKIGADERLRYCLLSLPLLEPVIRNSIEEYGWFDIKNIPALEFLIDTLTAQGLPGQLGPVKEIVEYFPQLRPWRDYLQKSPVKSNKKAK